MSRFGFVGPTYTSESPLVDSEECFNWYTESTEGQNAESAQALYPTPGTKLFASLANGNGACQAIYEINGRVFAVATSSPIVNNPPQTNLYELFANGSVTARGMLAGNPSATYPAVTMAANQQQLMVCSAGQLYAYTLATNVLQNVTTLLSPPAGAGGPMQVFYTDNSFVTWFQNSNSFQLSNLNDGTTWNSLNVAQASVIVGNIVGMLVDHRQIWIWSEKKAQVYFDNGAAYTPYIPDPGAAIEHGLAALQSTVQMDNSVFWIGQDERGNGIARRASGFLPTRVSNHAVETAWAQYSTISNAISYSYVEEGHTFWMIYFPSANTTWCYDAATSQWHRRGVWNPTVPGYIAHRSQCHAFAFGQHLVGDTQMALVWQMSKSLQYDLQNPVAASLMTIRRQRDAPAISSEKQWVLHHEMQIDLEPGLGLPIGISGYVWTYGGGSVPASLGQNPQATLTWSDNAAATWSNEVYCSAGTGGSYQQRIIFRRLGRSRNRIYRLVVSDPIPWRICDAYLQATPGFTRPIERLTKQLGKIA